MEIIVSWIVYSILAVFLMFCAKYAVTFMLKIFKPRGNDLTITHQIKDIEAENAQSAMKKAYKTLSETQKAQVTGVYMKRSDKE